MAVKELQLTTQFEVSHGCGSLIDAYHHVDSSFVDSSFVDLK